MRSWIDIEPGSKLTLPLQPGLPLQQHVFEPRTIWALNAALAANRPLLVRGEPGAGKSQLARAAATALSRPLVYEVITARTECNDLLWRFDAVARLADAQVRGLRPEEPSAGDPLDERRYLIPGPIWWCLNWRSAEEHLRRWRRSATTPVAPEGWEPDKGCVLLIDEIDKADSDVPNGLLEALGNGSFHVPSLDKRVAAEGGEPPLVILTTNEERDLPPAFLRRCLVLTLELDKDRKRLIEWLSARGEVHFGGACSKDTMRRAADMLVEDRDAAKQQGRPAPGQAEYLDLLRAITELGPDASGADRDKRHAEILDNIADFALKKSPPVAL